MKLDALAAIKACRGVLGNPYKLGANFDYSIAKPKGPIDCSGLILWGYARGGLKLPDMTAADLYARSYPVGKARPSDLGFQKDKDGHVDHVVMLTDDPDVVIEARSCVKHLGHLSEACPYNKVILRPRIKWDLWPLFTGFRRLKDIDE